MNHLIRSAAVLVIVSAASSIFAQTSESSMAPSAASAASYYYISKPGELTMQVNIWGAIHNPGRYEIPISTDLVQLVSYAGGPDNEAKLDQVHVTRAAKKDGTTSREQFTVNLEELGRVNEASLVLHPGDTIFIDRSTSWSTVRDLLSVVTTAAIITSAIANVIVAEQRLR